MIAVCVAAFVMIAIIIANIVDSQARSRQQDEEINEMIRQGYLDYDGKFRNYEDRIPAPPGWKPPPKLDKK